jgi:hypothetical protein
VALGVVGGAGWGYKWRFEVGSVITNECVGNVIVYGLKDMS